MKVPPAGYEQIPVDISALRHKKIGIIGYGNQAQPWGLNLFDSGMEVYIGLRTGSLNSVKALNSLIEVLPPKRIAKLCDIICLLIPDELIPTVLDEDIVPNAGVGSTIVLAHSYALFTRRFLPPKDMDTILLAPHGPGESVRRYFQAGSGIPAQWDIVHDFTGHAEMTAKALASALGFASGGLRRVGYREEAIIDLFSEQAVLVGGLLVLMREALVTLRDSGYDIPASRVSCIYEIKGIADLIAEYGLPDALDQISDAAAYGAYRAVEAIAGPLQDVFRKLLSDIENGEFSHNMLEASHDGFNAVKRLKTFFGPG